MKNAALAIVLSLLCAAGAAPAVACNDGLAEAIRKQTREQDLAAWRQERLMKEQNEILARQRR
ncbi:MAG TPA: hypothetical protein VF744_08170 [Beijerinckiaceae bacterium]|jgi:hypothetical protein